MLVIFSFEIGIMATSSQEEKKILTGMSRFDRELIYFFISKNHFRLLKVIIVKSHSTEKNEVIA